jgi:F0F1-type ATP synthase assembly protein I
MGATVTQPTITSWLERTKQRRRCELKLAFIAGLVVGAFIGYIIYIF